MKSGLRISGLSLVTIFSSFTIAAIVLFLYYVSELTRDSSFPSNITTPAGEKLEGEIITSYRGAILGLLFILSGMQGYVILRRLI